MTLNSMTTRTWRPSMTYAVRHLHREIRGECRLSLLRVTRKTGTQGGFCWPQKSLQPESRADDDAIRNEAIFAKVWMTTQNSSCFTSRVWHRFPFPPVDVAVKTGVFPPPTEIYYDGISSASILAIVNITFYIFCLKNRWYRMETRSEPLTTSAPKFIKFASCCLEKLICTSTRPGKGDYGGSCTSFAQISWGSSDIRFEKGARGVNPAFGVTGSSPCSLSFGVKIHWEDVEDASDGSLEDKSMRSVSTEITQNTFEVFKISCVAHFGSEEMDFSLLEVCAQFRQASPARHSVLHSCITYDFLIADGSLLVKGKMWRVYVYPASIALHCFLLGFYVEKDRKAAGRSLSVKKFKRFSSWF